MKRVGVAEPPQHGFISFRSWKLWYGIFNPDSHRAPLLLIPGGPAAAHMLFDPLVERAPANRPIVVYDPSGAGQSERPANVTWNVELFVDEVATLVAALRLERLHLFGGSFGGMVAMCYALGQPPGLASLTMASATPSAPLTNAALQRQIEAMSPEVAHGLLRSTKPIEYLRAHYAWSSRHMCRVPSAPLDEAVKRANMEAMIAMRGKRLIGYQGTARDFDVTERLPELRLPTLILCGAHDALHPEGYQQMQQAIAGSRLVVFPNASHVIHVEEPEAFATTLFSFLDEVDAR
jgi:proline-specific peptidase